LVVGFDAPVAHDIASCLQSAGAEVTTTTNVLHARLLVEHDGLTAAVLDDSLRGEGRAELCARMTARGVCCLIYSAETTRNVLDALGELLEGRPRISS
jgi:DNA-binding response OmpR family regulator